MMMKGITSIAKKAFLSKMEALFKLLQEIDSLHKETIAKVLTLFAGVILILF